ncbi:MAG: hypothetical protein IT449_19270 [Phycisphaerales bacterium]|nr:hypothetical protein [Phycisphaerales bacterium]
MIESSRHEAGFAPRRRHGARRLAVTLCGLSTLALSCTWLVSHALMIGWQGRTISVAAAFGHLRIWRWNATYPSGLIVDGAAATMAGWFFPQIVRLPLWPFALASLLLTIVMIRRMRRGFRAGCCATCGYDLTGNVSERCPECGVEVSDDRPTSADPRRPATRLRNDDAKE